MHIAVTSGWTRPRRSMVKCVALVEMDPGSAAARWRSRPARASSPSTPCSPSTPASAVDSLTPVASNDDAPTTEGFPGCASANSEVRFDATAGTTYRIAVDSTGGTVGRFSLRLRGRPGNDDFADAQALPLSTRPSRSEPPRRPPTWRPSRPASPTTPAARAASRSGSRGRPNASGPVSSPPAPTKALRTPTRCSRSTPARAVDSLTPVASNDDDAGSELPQLRQRSQLPRRRRHHLPDRRRREGPSTGRFDLRCEGRPANDDFAAAKTLGASLPASATGSTKAATEQSGEPDHAGEPGATASGTRGPRPAAARSSSRPAPTPNASVTLLAVYTGSGVGSLTPVASDDAGGGASCRPSASEVEFDAVAGTTYRIAVDGEAGSLGPVLARNPGPSGERRLRDAGGPRPDPMTAGGTNRLATKQAGEPSHAGDAGRALALVLVDPVEQRPGRHHRLRPHPGDRHPARRLHRLAPSAR